GLSKSYARVEFGLLRSNRGKPEKDLQAHTSGWQTAYSVHPLLDSAMADAVETLRNATAPGPGPVRLSSRREVSHSHCCPATGIVPLLRAPVGGWHCAPMSPRVAAAPAICLNRSSLFSPDFCQLLQPLLSEGHQRVPQRFCRRQVAEPFLVGRHD